MSTFTPIGRYSITKMSMMTWDSNGVAVEPDINPTVSMRTYSSGVEIISRMSVPGPVLGQWEHTISSVESATPGLFYLLWSWHLNTVAQVFRQDIEVSTSSFVAYPTLAPGAQTIVDAVWLKLADLFDSRFGGPHLQEYYQSSFGPERVAQLMVFALGRITSRVQETLNYNLTAADGYPYNEWSGILAQSLWIETLKHLARSYIEQPIAQGVPVSRLDRTNYARAWQELVEAEMREFDEMLDVFQMSMLGLGSLALIVSGGVYGKMSPPLNMPARGRHPVMPPRFW
jgi:hypothetical protein